MRLIPDQDQRDLAAMCRDVLTAECPTTLARALHTPDGVRVTPGLWKALAEAGVLGLAIEEGLGGSGGGLVDLGVFCVEAGQALCPMVVHSTLHAARAVDWLGSGEARETWLPPLASGERAGNHRVMEPARRFRADPVAARPRGRRMVGGWTAWPTSSPTPTSRM